MKTYISFVQMQEIAEDYNKRINAMTSMYEEILLVEEKIKHMSYLEKTEVFILQTKEALEENIRDLSKIAEILITIIDRYRRAEKTILDCYNLDTVSYPETQFGMSEIGNLDQFKGLIPF